MTMVTHLTRTLRFSAAHRYSRPEWSDEENLQRFGSSAKPHGHGHNYVLEVTVSGTPDPQTGFSVDLAELDALLHEQVYEPLDHQYLNHVVPRFAPGGQIPTTENIAIYLWERLAPRIPGDAELVRIRLKEDVDLWVDVWGETGSGGSA